MLHYGMIMNPSPSKSLRIDLPAVHDAEGIKGGWVKAIDQHYDKDVRVTLNTVYRNGSSVAGRSSKPVFTSGSSPATQLLKFGGWYDNISDHYYFSVTIPRPIKATPPASSHMQSMNMTKDRTNT